VTNTVLYRSLFAKAEFIHMPCTMKLCNGDGPVHTHTHPHIHTPHTHTHTHHPHTHKHTTHPPTHTHTHTTHTHIHTQTHHTHTPHPPTHTHTHTHAHLPDSAATLCSHCTVAVLLPVLLVKIPQIRPHKRKPPSDNREDS